MESLKLVSAVLFMTLPIVLNPPNLVITYIFLSKRKYRDLECYRIMIQSGLANLLITPGAFMAGLSLLLTNPDPIGFTSFTMKVFVAAIRIESFLGLVLALNRLKVICGLNYPSGIHTVFLVLTWSFGVLSIVIVMTPYADFVYNTDRFMGSYDFSKPLSTILTTIYTEINRAFYIITLLIYIIIALYLLRKKLTYGQVTTFNSEKTILAYAGIRFIFDIGLNFAFVFANLNEVSWIGFPFSLSHIINCLLVPPVLYLTFSQTLRKEFFAVFRRKKRNSSVVFSVTLRRKD